MDPGLKSGYFFGGRRREYVLRRKLKGLYHERSLKFLCRLRWNHKGAFTDQQNRGYLGRVRLGSIQNKNNWNDASKRLFGSHSHSGIPGFHSGYSAPRSRIAGLYSGIHSYSGIFPNERALNESS